MAQKQKVSLLVAGCLTLLAAFGVFRPGVVDVAHESIRLHLKLVGSSVYEHHARTGRWPTCAGELAITSLPQRSPYWKEMLDDEVIVVVWPKSLKPAPADNAGVVLAYHNKGLASRRGRVWVCWGDLRTEYVEAEVLRERLQGVEE